MKHNFTKTVDGICLVNPLNDEYTLCGDAFDIDNLYRSDEYTYHEQTKERVVTCHRCIAILKYCKGVKTQEPK